MSPLSLFALAFFSSMHEYYAPVAQVWDLALVLETDHHQHHVDSKLKKHLDLYAVEVSSHMLQGREPCRAGFGM